MILALGLLTALALLASVTAPLLTYGTSLAVFGGAHVLTELRYVDARFSPRLGHRLRWGLGLLLLAVAGLRVGKALDLWSGTPVVRVELVVVAALCALVLPELARAGLARLAVGAGLLGLLAWGLVTDPTLTILALAVAHNWTPLGFLAEGLPRSRRVRGLLLALIAFGLLPALVASGALQGLLPSWPEARLFASGTLFKTLGVYLPSAWHQAPWATALFSAVVFAQCMHYLVVIGVLPRLQGPRDQSWLGLGTMPGRPFLLGVLGLSAVAILGYALDFSEARAWYGVIAAVHAWIEMPLLLLALIPRAGSD